NNSSFRGDEDEHVELQAPFSDSQSTGKSSKSNVNSSSMKDKSYLPHYDSLSTVVENVQSEPILFSTTKYHEAEIEGLPSNQLPEIVEFQNTDNRKFVMCDDAHVHEEGVSDSRQTNSELLTSGKMLCSDLEPTKPVTLPAVIQSESTSYGQNDLIQNDKNSFSSTPDNKLEFETYFEPHLQCQLDEQDGEFPLNYEENFGSEKSQSQQMHINQMKQEGTHATSESVSETPADESPSFCSSPQSSGPEINPTQYVTDPLKPLLPDHFPKETENKLDGMPPMPPLPPMQWRMSKHHFNLLHLPFKRNRNISKNAQLHQYSGKAKMQKKIGDGKKVYEFTCKRELEKRIFEILEHVSINDLLVLSFTYDGERLLDLDSIRRIISTFVEKDESTMVIGGRR
ncbi:hypothetical protein RYX36_034371, partial [Vicia faba]